MPLSPEAVFPYTAAQRGLYRSILGQTWLRPSPGSAELLLGTSFLEVPISQVLFRQSLLRWAGRGQLPLWGRAGQAWMLVGWGQGRGQARGVPPPPWKQRRGRGGQKAAPGKRVGENTAVTLSLELNKKPLCLPEVVLKQGGQFLNLKI